MCTVMQCAIVAAALCSIVLVSFPSFSSTLGIVSEPQSVDRSHKSDRATDAPAATNIGLSHTRHSCRRVDRCPWL
jgi:hypothetical protein